MNTRAIAVIALLVGGLASGANARTWRVEKDGSGDFTVIQDAVDSAASGDSIFIGPGRFDDSQLVTVPGWSEQVYVLVTQSELTFIGSGDETIIGPEAPWDLPQGFPKGIIADPYFGNLFVTVCDLVVENVSEGMRIVNENTSVENCLLLRNETSIVGDSVGVLSVRACRFEYQPRDSWHIAISSGTSCEISDCMFVLDDVNQWGQGNISFLGVVSASIDGCAFIEGAAGVYAGIGSTVTIDNCTFQGESYQAIQVNTGASMTITDCAFQGINRLTECGDHDLNIFMRRCSLQDVFECTLKGGPFGDIDIQDCDLAAGHLGVVWMGDSCPGEEPRTLNMQNNYWGTDDADSIRALIRDSEDSDQACGTVLFEPFASQSTPTETTTWGAVKSLFR